MRSEGKEGTRIRESSSDGRRDKQVQHVLKQQELRVSCGLNGGGGDEEEEGERGRKRRAGERGRVRESKKEKKQASSKEEMTLKGSGRERVLMR